MFYLQLRFEIFLDKTLFELHEKQPKFHNAKSKTNAA